MNFYKNKHRHVNANGILFIVNKLIMNEFECRVYHQLGIQNY